MSNLTKGRASIVSVSQPQGNSPIVVAFANGVSAKVWQNQAKGWTNPPLDPSAGEQDYELEAKQPAKPGYAVEFWLKSWGGVAAAAGGGGGRGGFSGVPKPERITSAVMNAAALHLSGTTYDEKHFAKTALSMLSTYLKLLERAEKEAPAPAPAPAPAQAQPAPVAQVAGQPAADDYDPFADE